MTKTNTILPGPTSGLYGSLIDRGGIARDFAKSTRAVRNWEAAGILPPPDTRFQGSDYWIRSRYEAWKAQVLRGEFAGPARINNVRGHR